MWAPKRETKDKRLSFWFHFNQGEKGTLQTNNKQVSRQAGRQATKQDMGIWLDNWWTSQKETKGDKNHRYPLERSLPSIFATPRPHSHASSLGGSFGRGLAWADWLGRCPLGVPQAGYLSSRPNTNLITLLSEPALDPKYHGRGSKLNSLPKSWPMFPHASIFSPCFHGPPVLGNPSSRPPRGHRTSGPGAPAQLQAQAGPRPGRELAEVHHAVAVLRGTERSQAMGPHLGLWAPQKRRQTYLDQHSLLHIQAPVAQSPPRRGDAKPAGNDAT